MESDPLLDFDAISLSNFNPSLLDDSVLGMAFHSKGISGVTGSGDQVKLTPSSSMLARLAFPISTTELLLFHSSGIHKASIENGTSTQLNGVEWSRSIENGTSTQLSGVKWGRVTAAARCPGTPDKLLVFHEDGIYTVDVNSGSYFTVTEGWTVGWAAIRAVVHDPSNLEVIYIFHDLALYRVKLADGKYEKVGRHTWAGARAAIYHQMGAIVFHTDGTFRVQLSDGTCEKIAGVGGWPGARGVISSGHDTGLLLHTKGAHEVNLATGEFVHVSEATHWADLVCVTPLASDVVVSGAVCRYW
jgi:hypothetical protein